MSTTATAAEIATEQKYFDEAADAREVSRQTLIAAPHHGAGSRAAVTAMSKAVKAKLAKLPASDSPVAFGRLDCDKDDETFYVGYHAISNQQRDLLVINWQTKFISELWALGAHHAAGTLRRRRRYETERNTITSIDDEVFAEITRRVEELTENEQLGIDDALLHDIDIKRSGEMRDIVRTIHASQSALLHHPLESLLVVQGGPGTGKSAVALHRVSVLLFNHRDELAAEDVLVVGPNPTFSGYIKGLLPSLGDEGVLHQDLRGLGPIRTHSREESTAIARIKGELRMAGLLRRALRARVGLVSGRELAMRAGTMTVRLDPVEVAEHAAAILDKGSTYQAGRDAMRSWLRDKAAERTLTNALQVPADAIDAVLERVWPQLTAQQFIWELLGSRNRLLNAAENDFTVADIDLIVRDAAKRVTEERWSDTDVALLDEAQRLIGGRGGTYAHIVVDEAQDLSPMQLRSVRARSSRGSYTIVGDVAQSTGPWARDSWDDVIATLQVEHEATIEELTYGYRVPEQIFEYAARLLPLAAPGVTPPRIVRRGPADPDVVEGDDSADMLDLAIDAAERYAGKGRFVGVICAPDQLRGLEGLMTARGIQYDSADSGHIGKSINLMTAAESKGLEFDAVVLVEPAAIARINGTGLRYLYIALTRATQALTITHHEAFPLLGIGDEAIESPGVSLTAGPEVAALDGPPDPTLRQPTAAAASGQRSPRAPRIQGIADELVDDIKASVAPVAWQALVSEIARQLGVADVDGEG